MFSRNFSQPATTITTGGQRESFRTLLKFFPFLPPIIPPKF
ncbi:MAG TPA: hypothetical protein PLJ38_07215 [bacterium]|nr:hypothetical protein [bacterium]